MDKNIKHVFIIGAKSIGAYGGFETFVDKLTEYHHDLDCIKYHIACKNNGEGAMDETKLFGYSAISQNEFIYHNAHCFKIDVPQIGSAQAIIYDLKALNYCIKYIKNNNIANPILYVLACRIGPFFKHYVNVIHKLNGKVIVNPDGHEWKRAKWNNAIKLYWKKSEEMMVNCADLVVCDSICIEKYIHDEYDNKQITNKHNINTTYISYGVDIENQQLDNNNAKFNKFLDKYNLSPHNYYMTCGRFVPENNYETMIREFMKSNTKRDFALITTLNDALESKIENKYNYSGDKRIKFVGPVYDSELLKLIRRNAFANIHGHSVGGTNPSLLEGLACTRINLVYDCNFNREVGGDGALYWNLNVHNLEHLINCCDKMSEEDIININTIAIKNLNLKYKWDYICSEYLKTFDGI